MLRSAKELYGFSVQALDKKEIGKINDLLFDQEKWSIHYLIANTSESRFLVPAPSISALEWKKQLISSKLSSGKAEAFSGEKDALKSVWKIIGQNIKASDGDLGNAEDVLFDDKDWKLRYLVVDTHSWLPGKKVLVEPKIVSGIDWKSQGIQIGLKREKVVELSQKHTLQEART